VPLDRLAAAGDPQLRRIVVYARGRRDPFTAAEAAAALDLHRNVARSRLDRLVDSGFLSVAFERRGGRRGPGAGRPAKIYRVAPELEAVEFPDRRLVELIGLLVETIRPSDRVTALREAGESFGRSLAAAGGLKPRRGVKAALEAVCDALGSLGFHASVVSLDGDRAELASPTCPLRPLVVKYPEAAAMDRAMWAGLVESSLYGGSARRIECETPACLSPDRACSILLSLGVEASKPSIAG
jgi:predicted ArsR family transcriptional regulator